MEVRKLSNHKSAQCKVFINDDGQIIFVSYSTPVIQATPRNGKYEVFCTGTYSQTTRRQISWFLREYFSLLNYYDMKRSAEDCAPIVTTRTTF